MYRRSTCWPSWSPCRWWPPPAGGCWPAASRRWSAASRSSSPVQRAPEVTAIDDAPSAGDAGRRQHARWIVHVALMGTFAAALVALLTNRSSIGVHIVLGLSFTAMVMVHLVQRQRTVRRLVASFFHACMWLRPHGVLRPAPRLCRWQRPRVGRRGLHRRLQHRNPTARPRPARALHQLAHAFECGVARISAGARHPAPGPPGALARALSGRTRPSTPGRVLSMAEEHEETVEISGRQVRVSNPDKVYFPAIEA